MALISVPPVWTTASHSDMRLLALNHFSEEDAIVKKIHVKAQWEGKI